MDSRVLFRNTWRFLRDLLASSFVLARLQKKYPNCQFYPGSYVDETSVLGNYNVIFKNTSIINSVLGDHTFVQKNSFINCAEIGKFCSIAMNVYIGPGQHPTAFVSSHPAFYSSSQPLVKTFSKTDKFDPFKKIIIGHDVWLGQNCIVMDGVTIGTGAVVGAGAVVTKNVPHYGIVGGVPARLIKYRFDEKVRELLLESQWWDWPESQMTQYIDYFSNVNLFLNLWKEKKLQQ